MTKILMIAEKDSQADNIADAFNLHLKLETVEIKKGLSQTVKYYKGQYDNNSIILISTKGHLLGLRGRSSDILYFGFTWKEPTLRSKDHKARYKLMKKYAAEVDEIIIATDADDEGELIGYNIVNHFNVLHKTMRMIYISMTEKALRTAFVQKANLRINIAKAAEIRTWMDKVFGYIFSKYLTKAYCSVTNAQYMQLPVGRVMTPVLFKVFKNINKIEKVMRELKDHVPEVIYDFNIKAIMPNIEDYSSEQLIDIDDYVYNLSFEEANKIKWKYKGLKGKITSVTKGKFYVRAPDAGLTIDDIRRWAYNQGIDYGRSESILQALYMKKLISYPRTESTNLPKEAEYHEEILANCLKYLNLDDVNDLIERNVPNMGDEFDGAHYGIHPTEEKPMKLPYDYSMIYNYIVKNYVKGFCKNKVFWKHECEAEFLVIPFEKRFSIDFNGEIGYSTVYKKKNTFWKTVIEQGFECIENLALLNYEIPERDLVPNVKVGDIVRTEALITKGLDMPSVPSQVKKNNLFEFMFKNSLGTDATRGGILEKLWHVNLLIGNPPIPTVLGMRICEAIAEINPRLTKPNLTKDFDNFREDVKNDTRSLDDVKADVKETIIAIINDKLEDLERIGEQLAFFGECQKCESRMKLVSWNKNGEFLFFLACESNDCGFTSPI